MLGIAENISGQSYFPAGTDTLSSEAQRAAKRFSRFSQGILSMAMALGRFGINRLRSESGPATTGTGGQVDVVQSSPARLTGEAEWTSANASLRTACDCVVAADRFHSAAADQLDCAAYGLQDIKSVLETVMTAPRPAPPPLRARAFGTIIQAPKRPRGHALAA
jgi:hypothetical protein